MTLNIDPGIFDPGPWLKKDHAKALFEGTLRLGAGGNIFIDENGFINSVPQTVGTLPADVTIKNSVYMAGTSPLPAGLSSNGGVIMTDGSVFYPNTFSNGGVLSVNPNVTGA